MSRARSTRVSKRRIANAGGALETLFAQFEVGAEYQVASTIIMRELEDFKSPEVVHLQPGSTVTLLQIGSVYRRARVRNESCGDGWISICDPCGRCYIVPKGTQTQKAFHPGDCGRDTAAWFAQAAHDGDLQSLLEAMNSGDSSHGGDDWLSIARTNSGKTALMGAAASGHLDIAEFLISKNVSVNVADDQRRTALHHACCTSGDRVALVQALVHARADHEAKDVQGDTPLALAVANGDTRLISVLLKSGANLNAQNKEGPRLLDYTEHLRYDEIAPRLEEVVQEGCPSEMDEWPASSNVLHIASLPDAVSADIRDTLPISCDLEGNATVANRKTCLKKGLRVPADVARLRKRPNVGKRAGSQCRLSPLAASSVSHSSGSFASSVPYKSNTSPSLDFGGLSSVVDATNHVSASPCDSQEKEQVGDTLRSSTTNLDGSLVKKAGRVAPRATSCVRGSRAKQLARKPKPAAIGLTVGVTVRLLGLKNDVGYNGKRGELVSIVQVNGEKACLIKFEDGEENLIRRENLVVDAPDLSGLPSSPSICPPDCAMSENMIWSSSEALDVPTPAKKPVPKKGRSRTLASRRSADLLEKELKLDY